LVQEQIPWIDHGNLRTLGRLDVAADPA
jgi:hypothetical protein